MKIGRILSPVHSLGPGNRICIWTQGCSKHCYRCISPEFQSFDGKDINENTLAKIIIEIAKKNHCTGLTISGGDPFEQSESLYILLQLLRNTFDDILVYTGYELSEIENGSVGEKAKKCLSYLDVIIDGRYIDELNFNDCILRGSINQNIHFMNTQLIKNYNEYMQYGRILEVLYIIKIRL